MIDELNVRDIALIQHASLFPARGLTAITGETGAGKTALLQALKLLCGERADADQVREGASSLEVQGRILDFDSPESDGLVAQRLVTSDGRSRVHINGAMAQVGQLAATVGATIDLCGQHEHQRLMSASNHRRMLDAWAGGDIAPSLAAYREAYAAAARAAEAVAEVREAGRLDAAAIEQARYVIRRIDEVAPVEAEYENLAEAVPRIENSESLKRSVEGAHCALSGEGGTLDTLAAAASLLESSSAFDEALAAKASSLREASYIIEDVARDIRSYSDSIEYDAASLQQMQDRLAQLQGLMRAWGPTISEVLSAREKAQATVDAVEGFERRLAEVEQAQAAAEQALEQAAQAVHEARCQAAPRFAKKATEQMARLDLAGAQLECAVEKKARECWTEDGPDAVQFMFRPGADLSPKPLAKIASGGEISRVMLAIKVALGSSDEVDTLVFDEVDAGIGGTAARALTAVLLDLARTHQVIVVTHLAQVAVAAEMHYVARKLPGDSPETLFSHVDGEQRVREIARMLSGDDSQATMDHARQLLREAASAQAREHASAALEALGKRTEAEAQGGGAPTLFDAGRIF